MRSYEIGLLISSNYTHYLHKNNNNTLYYLLLKNNTY